MLPKCSRLTLMQHSCRTLSFCILKVRHTRLPPLPYSDVLAGKDFKTVQLNCTGALMDAKHRYRLLIYFAALILCLSVCFANAEEVSPATPQPHRQTVIFEGTHGHAAFMPALQQSYMVTRDSARTESHVVPPSVLQQVTAANRSRRFWHGSGKHRVSLLQDHEANASAGVANNTHNADSAASTGYPAE